jgi:PAS domain S-box-containing protein
MTAKRITKNPPKSTSPRSTEDPAASLPSPTVGRAQLDSVPVRPAGKEEFFRTVIHFNPDPMVLLQDGAIRIINPQFSELLGYSQDDLDLSLEDIIPEGEWESVSNWLSQVEAGKAHSRIPNIELRARNEGTVPCELTVRPIVVDDELADLMLIRDISDRADIENEIRNMKEMYETLVTTSPDAITVTDIQGNLTFLSDQTLQLHGYSGDQELIGKSALMLIAPDEHERAVANLGRTLDDGILQGLEYNMIRVDGTTFVGELNVALIRDHYGQPKGFIATVRDITGRKVAEGELRRSEEKYRALAEGIQEGVYNLDSEGRFTYVNDVIIQRSGKSRDWFMGRHFLENIREDTRARATENFNATLRGKKAPMAEVAIHSTNGSVLWMEINTTAIYREGGIVGIFGVSRDISQRKAYERVQKVMVDITTATNVQQGLGDLFSSIRDHLSRIIDTTNFFIALYDRETDMISLPYFIDESDSFSSIPARKTFTSYVIRNDKPILITESDIDELVRTGEVEVVGTKPKVWVGVPLKREGEVIGAVVVQDYSDEGKYSEEDFEVLKFVSNNIAPAITRRSMDEALRESEEKYRTLFNWSTDAIFIHTPDLKIYDMNERAIDLMGYTREEMLNLKVTDLHPKKALEGSRDAFQQIDRDGYIHIKIDFRRKNGDIFTADLSSSVFELGGKRFIQGIVRDITEQESASASLRESEEKFRTFAEQSPNMIFINQQNSIRYVNQRCVDTMGYSREEFYSPDFNFWVLFEPGSIPIIQEKFARHQQSVEIAPYEYQLMTRDGRIIDAISNSRIIEFEGEPALLGIVTDTTEINQTQRRLELSEDRYRKIFETTREGIIVTDSEGRIVSANPGAASMLGYQTPDDLNGMYEIDLFVEQERQQALTRDLEEMGNLENIELQLMRKDDRTTHVLCTASLRSSEIDEGYQRQLIFMDITERKRSEDEMKRRLMKFRLEEGNFYLVQESTPTLSFEAFKDLQQVGYSGVVFSRSIREELAEEIDGDFEYHWLAEKEAIFSLRPEAGEIIKQFGSLTHRHVVIIDRLNYLIFKLGFKKALSMVQYIRELIYLKGTIVILSIDPHTLKPEQLRLLEKECREVEPLHKNILSDDLFNILKYIYRQNTLGFKPSYSAIGKELGISKPTVRKRVGDLIATGYIREDVKGRNKAVELTERGRQLFWK